eukprot:NODE_77_length_23338_cov_0.319463.p2 type:complete len:617 gc:universal NODE_77_length_23338_cov_0.319463:9349-7499(-)
MEKRMKRKLQRQEERKAKKQRKSEYFSKKNTKKDAGAIKETVDVQILNDDPFFSETYSVSSVDLVVKNDEGEKALTPVNHAHDEDLNYYSKKLNFRGKMPKWEEWEDFQDLLGSDAKTEDDVGIEIADKLELKSATDCSVDSVNGQESLEVREYDSDMEGDTEKSLCAADNERTVGASAENDALNLSSDHVKHITRWLNRLSLKTFGVVSDEISSIISIAGTLPVATYLVNVLVNCSIEGVLWFDCALICQLSFKDSKGPLFATQIFSKCVELLLNSESKKTIFTCICCFIHCRMLPVNVVTSILQKYCDNDKHSTALDLSSVATELLGEQLRKECRNALSAITDNLNSAKSKWTGSRNNFLFSKFSSLLLSKFDVRKYESIPSVWSDLQPLFKQKSTLLSIDLKDILEVESQGMWWISGTRFNGYSSKQIKERISQLKQKDKTNQLAAQMGMNTDIRKMVFTTIMNSQDYLDASEQLMHMKLRKSNEREIINVIFQLVKALKKSNPFYLFLLKNVCNKLPSLEFSCRKRIYQILEEPLNDTEFRNCVEMVEYCIHHKLMYFSSIVKAADFENNLSLSFVQALVEKMKKNHSAKFSEYMSEMDSGLKIKLKSQEIE